MKRKWTKEEFIQKYDELQSSRKMAKFYNCAKTTILNYARQIGYNNQQYSQGGKLDNISKEKLIEVYEQTFSLKETAKFFNCKSTAIKDKLKKFEYDFSKAKKINNKSKIKDIDKEEFIQMYNTLKSAKKVAEELGCSSTTVLKKAEEIGYKPKSCKQYKLTEEDKKEIISLYYKKSSNELAEKYNVSRGMITKIWYDNNLKGKIPLQVKTTEIDLTGQTFGYWTVLSKTDKRNISGNTIWHCRCKCGIERDVNGLSLRNGTSLSCGAHSNVSKGNEKIKFLLLNANIPFEMEKKFSTCKDKLPLPFDFFVNNSYLIEFDGIQHFEESIFDYEYTHSHDIIKSQWCKDNNIPLIRIPYTRLKELCLNDLLLEKTKFLEK